MYMYNCHNIFWYHICSNHLSILKLCLLDEHTSQFLSISKVHRCLLLFIFAWPMSSFVLVLRNQNKAKFTPSVLFNQRQIQRQIMVISRFTVPFKACSLPVKPDKRSFEEAFANFRSFLRRQTKTKTNYQ